VADPAGRLKDLLDELVSLRVGGPAPAGTLVWPNAVEFGTAAAYLEVGLKHSGRRRRRIVGEIIAVICLWSVVATAMTAASDPFGSALVFGIPALVIILAVIALDQVGYSIVQNEEAMAKAIDPAVELITRICDLVSSTIASATEDPLAAEALPTVVLLLESRLGLLLDRPGDPIQMDAEQLGTLPETSLIPIVRAVHGAAVAAAGGALEPRPPEAVSRVVTAKQRLVSRTPPRHPRARRTAWSVVAVGAVALALIAPFAGLAWNRHQADERVEAAARKRSADAAEQRRYERSLAKDPSGCDYDTQTDEYGYFAFCDGTAKVTVHRGSLTYELTGGECADHSPMEFDVVGHKAPQDAFDIHAGTDATRHPRPNFFELTVPPGTGDWTEGSTYKVTTASVPHAAGGTFEFPSELRLAIDGHEVKVLHFRANVDPGSGATHGTFEGNQGTTSAFSGSFRC